MALAGIEQAQLLSDIFAGVLGQYAPRSVAVLGCAGGNGFDRIAPSVSRVVGVDINPDYVAAAEARFRGHFRDLELITGDIQKPEVSFVPVDLVFAGLVLEYVSVEDVIGRMPGMLAAGGRWVTVLQLPGAGLPQISRSPYSSLQALAGALRLVPPARVRSAAAARGYVERESHQVVSGGGKPFQVQVFGARSGLVAEHPPHHE